MEQTVVLDASALLALIQNEPGASRIAAVMETNTILVSTINVAEAATKLVRSGMLSAKVSEILEPFAKSAEEFTIEQAMLVAELDRITQPVGLSLGDRACLALALSRGASVLTTDRAWKKVEVGVEVMLVR